jgi:hypothetical protein
MRTRIHGRTIPGARLTGWGAWMILVRLGLPVLGSLVLLDVLLYLVFTRALGRCYGLLCWMG